MRGPDVPVAAGATAGKYLGLGLLLAIAVAVPTLSGGGFDASTRSLFVALAGAALLAAGTIDGRAAVRAARSPLALTLVAIAVLSIASVSWTVGSRAAAVRWGLVIGGYAAVYIAVATLARSTGPWPVAAGIAVLALVEAIIGLRGVAFHALPDAERIGRAWRPGGTFEYPPALAILEVGALPVLSCVLNHRRASIAAGAAVAAALAGAILGLADSRLAIGFAAALLFVLIVRPLPGTAGRTPAIAITAIVLIGGLLAPVVLGGNVAPTTPGAGITGAVAIAGLALTAGIAWLIIRRTSRSAYVSTWAGATILIIAIAAVYVTGIRNSSHLALEPSHATTAHLAAPSDLLHGRGHEWSAAIETWLDYPLLGAGADAYYLASLPHQTVAHSRFAHDLPLELAAELGTLGLLLGVALYASTALTISKAHSPALWVVGTTAAMFLISNLVDWTWHLAGLGAIWAAATGALNPGLDS